MGLTLIRFNHKDKRHRTYNLYKCDCGNEKVIHQASVNSRNTRSCGCLSKAVKSAKRLDNDSGTVNQIILQYKRHAKNRNLNWLLTREQAETLFRGVCHYCGDPHGNLKKTKNNKEGLKYNGIDRKNNRVGYTVENCIPCCKICNRAKSNMDYEEFTDWIKAMANQWG